MKPRRIDRVMSTVFDRVIPAAMIACALGGVALMLLDAFGIMPL